MELREYLTIRRAYNLVRRQRDARERLTFAELAILCFLSGSDAPLATSQIADYQNALRPTMSHRTERLSRLNLLERIQGLDDRRNVLCRITSEGIAVVQKNCADICDILRRGSVLSRTMPSRLLAYVTAMGSICLDAGELVLLVLNQADEMASTVGVLAESLGLLQPTVSMAVSSLVQSGAVVRAENARGGRAGSTLWLSDQGRERAEELLNKVQATVVRRIR